MAHLKKANVLGDLRAEADHQMLAQAYYETPDYKTLVESPDATIVVGRRGTGKSALFFRLSRHWATQEKTRLVTIAPDENEIIGLRPFIGYFGTEFRLIRAGARLAWRYGLFLEIALALASHFKFAEGDEQGFLITRVREWRKADDSIGARLRAVLKQRLSANVSPEDQIGELATKLELTETQTWLEKVLELTQQKCYVLIDRLDEGYEPDNQGIGLVVGFTHAAVDINSYLAPVHVLVLMRDNIFRAVARLDVDFSRSLEGQVLRLHWDEYNLFNMICNRFRVAFGIQMEENLRVWDACTSRDIKGKDGFRHCLQLTLYRPRDLLALLNRAFYSASKQTRKQIDNDDIEFTAKEISDTRLADLTKEYSAIIPGLEKYLRCFANGAPELPYAEAYRRTATVGESHLSDGALRQHAAIVGCDEIIRSMYSIGFLGLKHSSGSSFVFCHDGKSPDQEFSHESRLLVHPCYWMALNLAASMLQPEEAAEIHDEYDIEVSSDTPANRNKRIGQIISELNGIPLGNEGAPLFEEWCHQAVRILFASSLRNVELKPNKDATQRRDIVGTNSGETPAWRRILEDYGARQVIFEVKNYDSDLGPQEFRQMNSYLYGTYGLIGFIVNRSVTIDPEKGRELDWIREIHTNHKKLIIKLNATFLSKLLSKIRSPQKHNAPDQAIQSVLDRYSRLYLSGATAKRR